MVAALASEGMATQTLAVHTEAGPRWHEISARRCKDAVTGQAALLVLALAGTQLDKARLRATLVTVWFSLNSLLTVAFLLDGRLLPALPQVLSYAPLLLIGVWLGKRLHRRFNEQHFRIAIYLLLLVTGGLLLVAGH